MSGPRVWSNSPIQALSFFASRSPGRGLPTEFTSEGVWLGRKPRARAGGGGGVRGAAAADLVPDLPEVRAAQQGERSRLLGGEAESLLARREFEPVRVGRRGQGAAGLHRPLLTGERDHAGCCCRL